MSNTTTKKNAPLSRVNICVLLWNKTCPFCLSTQTKTDFMKTHLFILWQTRWPRTPASSISLTQIENAAVAPNIYFISRVTLIINNYMQAFTSICWENFFFTPTCMGFSWIAKPIALSCDCSFNMSFHTLCSCAQLKIGITAKQMVLMSTVASSRDPFAAHRHQMRAMFGTFGMAPFGVTAPMQPHRAPRRQVTDGSAQIIILLWIVCRPLVAVDILIANLKIKVCLSPPGGTSGSLWHDGDGECHHNQRFLCNVKEYGDWE